MPLWDKKHDIFVRRKPIFRPKGVLLLCSLAHIALQERPYRNAIWAKLQSKSTPFGREKDAHFH